VKDISKYADFWNPLLRAVKLLGGSGTVDEINNKDVDVMGLETSLLEKLRERFIFHLHSQQSVPHYCRVALEQLGACSLK
jgi:hypothetical protein